MIIKFHILIKENSGVDIRYRFFLIIGTLLKINNMEETCQNITTKDEYILSNYLFYWPRSLVWLCKSTKSRNQVKIYIQLISRREFEKTPTLNMLSFAFYIFMVTYRKTIFGCIIYIQHIYNIVKTLTLSFSKVLVTAGTKTNVEGSHWDYGHFCKGPPQSLDHERTAS